MKNINVSTNWSIIILSILFLSSIFYLNNQIISEKNKTNNQENSNSKTILLEYDFDEEYYGNCILDYENLEIDICKLKIEQQFGDFVLSNIIIEKSLGFDIYPGKTIKEGELWSAELRFKGESIVSGEYGSYHLKGNCMEVNDDDIEKIPKFGLGNTICFKGEWDKPSPQIKELYEGENGDGTRPFGTATIKIKDYTIHFSPTDIMNKTAVEEVIDRNIYTEL